MNTCMCNATQRRTISKFKQRNSRQGICDLSDSSVHVHKAKRQIQTLDLNLPEVTILFHVSVLLVSWQTEYKKKRCPPNHLHVVERVFCKHVFLSDCSFGLFTQHPFLISRIIMPEMLLLSGYCLNQCFCNNK